MQSASAESVLGIFSSNHILSRGNFFLIFTQLPSAWMQLPKTRIFLPLSEEIRIYDLLGVQPPKHPSLCHCLSWCSIGWQQARPAPLRMNLVFSHKNNVMIRWFISSVNMDISQGTIPCWNNSWIVQCLDVLEVGIKGRYGCKWLWTVDRCCCFWTPGLERSSFIHWNVDTDNICAWKKLDSTLYVLVSMFGKRSQSQACCMQRRATALFAA